jgi:hypothetical protein
MYLIWRKAMQMPDEIARVAAGRTPEFIEMLQAGLGRWSGSARLVCH